MDDQQTAQMPEVPDPGQTRVMPETPAPSTQMGGPGGGSVAPQSDTAGPSGPDRKNTLIIVAVVVIILLLGACAAVYLWQRREAQDLEDRAAEAERLVEELTSQATQEDTSSADTDSEAESEAEPEDEDEPDDGAEPDPTPEADSGGVEDGRFIGLVTDIYNVGQSRWVKMDYIQFLTGAEAAAAAEAHGDEVLDFYILNENPRIREIQVREGLSVTMWTWNMEHDGVQEQNIPFDIWWDEIEMHGVTHYMDVPYWVTIDNGVIIDMEEQYLP